MPRSSGGVNLYHFILKTPALAVQCVFAGVCVCVRVRAYPAYHPVKISMLQGILRHSAGLLHYI